MKNYKKLSKIAPICVLSTSLLVGAGNSVFAAEQEVKDVASPMDIAIQQTPSSFAASSSQTISKVLQADFKKAVQQALKNKPELFSVGYDNPNTRTPVNKVTDPDTIDALNHFTTYSGPYDIFGSHSRAAWDTATFELTGVDDNLDMKGAQNGDPKVVENVQLLNYHNYGDLEQTYTTVAQQRSVTDSFTYSNSEGAKAGISTSSKVGIDIPFIGSGSETITVSAEFNYNHTSSNTTSTTKTITFPSQNVICMPHGTTVFMGLIEQGNFSGTYTGPFRVVEPKNVGVQVMTSYGADFISLFPAAGEEGHLLYNAFKYSGQPLPAYLNLDDATKSVIIKNPATTITFTGQAGFQENATLSFTPDDTSKPSVTMPYAEYMDAQESGKLTEYVNNKINEEMKKNN
ncbi:ETX/MTX2 family pore-forming toxin [Bacillus cereus]|uniref:ETX/MTX2 family pore-forming toxin n=1 Tax=Bacillus cereus TaxID=1396 RepID=UPI0024052CE1|nr:ETX/MTX2 family pore-forming toxin [Bacillus cereus]MDF9627297.1 ETX/MTX2 family pore-forming toxin [Bacillus cereus]